jgi:hypothetical protein
MDARFAPTIGGIALVVLLAACGGTASPKSGAFNPSGSSDSVSSSAPVTPSSAPVETAPSAMTTEQITTSVLNGYRKYQAAYEAAYETNDPSGLTAVSMDPLLSTITKDIEKTKAKGEFWRFHNSLNPKIQRRSKDNMTVVVVDCVRALVANRFSIRTGKRLSRQEGGALLYQAVVKYDSGTWKVSSGKWGTKC